MTGTRNKTLRKLVRAPAVSTMPPSGIVAPENFPSQNVVSNRHLGSDPRQVGSDPLGCGALSAARPKAESETKACDRTGDFEPNEVFVRLRRGDLTGSRDTKAGPRVEANSAANHQTEIHDMVQEVVSDLDSLLSFIINLRFGLDGSPPCSHEEIAALLNENLRSCVKEKVQDLLGITRCTKIDPAHVQELEAKAERALCRRRVAQ
jgi:hypothetical protein